MKSEENISQLEDAVDLYSNARINGNILQIAELLVMDLEEMVKEGLIDLKGYKTLGDIYMRITKPYRKNILFDEYDDRIKRSYNHLESKFKNN